MLEMQAETIEESVSSNSDGIPNGPAGPTDPATAPDTGGLPASLANMAYPTDAEISQRLEHKQQKSILIARIVVVLLTIAVLAFWILGGYVIAP